MGLKQERVRRQERLVYRSTNVGEDERDFERVRFEGQIKIHPEDDPDELLRMVQAGRVLRKG